MSDTTCLARLLSSAVHDLRNVLAVVRESSGLTADLLRLQEDVPKRDRMLSALSEVQAQVARGALLASAMDLLAECGAAGKAGSGDVLTGAVCGICAVLSDDITAGMPTAVCLHGRAGSLASRGISEHGTLARETAEALPKAFPG